MPTLTIQALLDEQLAQFDSQRLAIHQDMREAVLGRLTSPSQRIFDQLASDPQVLLSLHRLRSNVHLIRTRLFLTCALKEPSVACWLPTRNWQVLAALDVVKNDQRYNALLQPAEVSATLSSTSEAQG